MIRLPNMALVVATIFATLVISGHAEPPASDAPAAPSSDTADLTRQRDRLELENSLRDEKLRQDLAETQAELAHLKSENELMRARADR